MIGQYLDAFTGLTLKETDLNTELWEEVPRYVMDRATNGVLGIKWDVHEYPSARAAVMHKSNIEWDAQEPPRGSDDEPDDVEVTLIAEDGHVFYALMADK